MGRHRQGGDAEGAHPQLPLAEKLPKPQDIVTNAYDFAEKLLSSQRQFAQELVQATAPLRPGSDAREEQAAAAE